MRSNKKSTNSAALIPRINAAFTVKNKTLRFLSAGGQLKLSITAGKLLDTMLVASSTTTLYQLFDTCKLKYVEIWAPNPAQGTATNISIEASSNATLMSGRFDVFEDTTVNPSVPAHVKWFPSARSVAGNIIPGNSVIELFRLTLPAGVNCIIDVCFSELTFNNADPPVAALQPGVSLTPGQTYFRGLDALPTASSTLPPVVPGQNVA